MRPSPFDLVEANLHVKRIDVVFVFIADKLFIDHISIFQFGAIFHLQHSRGLEQIPPPARRVLLLEIVLEDIHLFIRRRQLEGVDFRRIFHLLLGELRRERLGSDA